MLGFATTVTVVQAGRQATGTGVEKCSGRGRVHITPRMGPWKKGEKDDAFQKQQEILARRRDKGRNKAHFDEIRKRREELEAYYDERRLKVPVGEDPIIAWQKLKDDGFLGERLGYDEMDEGGIPIPMASFGIPKYDNGGRFDLRLPHVEVGYTDPEADVMSKAGNALKNMFGFGKKKDDVKDGVDETDEEK